MLIKDYVAKKKSFMHSQVLSYERPPVLAIIQVNDDAASNAYVKGKIKDAQEIGVEARLFKLAVDTTQDDLIALIKRINGDHSIDGLIVQMPLPKHIDENEVKLSISPAKDVDGFHPLSQFLPCTPKGIISYLKEEGVVFEGRNALVIGRSNIVGKPMAKLLLQHNCNVIIVHSKTKSEDLNFFIKNADIIVVAVGKKWLLSEQSFKKDAVIVDVGINRIDGHLYGDAKPGLDVRLQTPVPGGIGLITRITLLENLLEAYENGIQH